MSPNGLLDLSKCTNTNGLDLISWVRFKVDWLDLMKWALMS